MALVESRLIVLPRFFLAIKEKRFARRAAKRLLKSYSAVSTEQPGLSGKTLYREVLLHDQRVDALRVDDILQQAENSIDEWTARGRDTLGFREVVHFSVLLQYQSTGHPAAIISFGDIVNSLIPAKL